MKTLPFGSWPSPLGAEEISAHTLKLREVQWDGSRLFWIEGRPSEGGRQAVMTQAPGESIREASPPATDARTKVHEYGGGSYVAHKGTLYYTRYSDQTLWSAPYFGGGRALTEPGMRFADPIVDEKRKRLILVGEQQKENFLVAVPLSGGTPKRIQEGADFYAFPRLSPDGKQLAWMQWNHPSLPWDSSELWMANVSDNGALTGAKKLAGGPGESVFQPEWSPGGKLHFVSDRTGWWNLYRWEAGGAKALCPKEAEFGEPLWQFGASTYAFLSETKLVVNYGSGGSNHLALLDATTGKLETLQCPHTAIMFVKASGTDFAYIGGRPDGPAEVVRSDGKRYAAIRKAHEIELSAISLPEPFTFPGYKGAETHGFFYPPASSEYEGPDGSLPPCLMVLHGGPTGQTTTSMLLSYQFWTSRGFAVADINYGGSTGYGRAYWERLRGGWGVVDVEDSRAAVRFLTERKRASGFAIRGGSAGGYTTLCAVLSPTPFRAGASYYGVSDLKLLIQDTHKFESRYDDFLLGPDASEKLIRERSPIHQISRLSTPVIFFQGLEDAVVPPNQSEILYNALKEKGVLTGYVPFEGEGHGFRKAENQKRALEAELYFYSKVFGFPPPPMSPPLSLANA